MSNENVLNNAMKFFEAEGSRCTLVVTGDNHKLLNTVPVIIYDNTGDLPPEQDNIPDCNSMLVIHNGKESMTKGLPWIPHPIIITSSLEWFLNTDTRLKRLEPIFFVWKNTSDLVLIHAWHFKEEIKMIGTFGINGLNSNENTLTGMKELAQRMDFKGNAFPAVAFNFPPYSVPDYANQENNGGYEYEITSVVAKALNLKLTVHPPSRGGLWGLPDEHGNYTGMGQNSCVHSIVSPNSRYNFRTYWRPAVWSCGNWLGPPLHHT